MSLEMGNVLNTVVSVTVSENKGSYSTGKCGDTQVYVIGLEGTAVQGRVAAVVSGFDKERYVVVPQDKIVYEPEIEHILGLEKENAGISYTCSHEKSCGAIIFTEESGERKYLIIKNRSFHPGFPKGHIEYGEDELATVRREIAEETGLTVELVDGFRFAYDYKVRGFINKTAVYYLAKYENQTIVPQEGEVLDYWIVNAEKAMELLDFDDDKKLFSSAVDFMNK